jgi:hypothetical protein
MKFPLHIFSLKLKVLISYYTPIKCMHIRCRISSSRMDYVSCQRDEFSKFGGGWGAQEIPKSYPGMGLVLGLLPMEA